jgi:predicted DNA-binding transcriptional regulator AlpA
MRLLNHDDLRERGIPWKRDRLRQLMRAGEFPQAVSLTDRGNRLGWIESEVDDWLTARAALRQEPVTA